MRLGWLFGVIVLALGCAQGDELADVGHGSAPDGGGGGSALPEGGADASNDVSVGGGGGEAATGPDAADATGEPTGDEVASDAGDESTTNPCAGVTCNTPPPNTCAGASTLTVYNASGTCDLGQCQYASTPTACVNGCSSDACNGDPCVGVTCATPPPNACADATHLLVYDLPGACSGGTCSYPSTHLQYCQFGCANAVCNGDPCAGKSCQTPPASYCSDATHLAVYDTPGTCTSGVCAYTTHGVYCAYGCSGGACANDPCAGVSCNTPPAPYCVDASTLRSPGAGTCSNGACSYANTDTTCPHGCVSGVCKDCATSSDCAAGKWCNAGVCASCNADQHCGAACSDCTTTSGVCSGGTTCVQCTTDSQCGAGKWCNAGTCAACTTDQRCGPTCAACSGGTPTCSGGACVCSAASCGSNQSCVSGACAVCKSDASCGASCGACGGATPKCLDQGTTSTCVACTSDADCAGGNVCGSSHTCVAPGCPPPAASCTTGSENRKGCAGARTIGRKAAAAKYKVSDSTCSASDDSGSSSSCDASGPDHSYRLYMRAGETARAQLTWTWPCDMSTNWQADLKIYSSLGCGDTTCPTLTYCNDYYFSDDKTFTASQDGWYFIVVDGNYYSFDYDDAGDYTLTVTLTCKVAGCECP